MLRMSKLTDYATVVLAYLAHPLQEPDKLHTTAEVARQTGLPPTTASKLLKALARSGLVVSHRGSNGGYALARGADDISAAEIIDALEGPVSITECSAAAGQCDLEPTCGVGSSWQRVNLAIRSALQDITLAQLCDPGPNALPPIHLDSTLAEPTGQGRR